VIRARAAIAGVFEKSSGFCGNVRIHRPRSAGVYGFGLFTAIRLVWPSSGAFRRVRIRAKTPAARLGATPRETDTD